MTRIIIVAVALALGGASAEAGARKGARPEARALQSAPVAARLAPARPFWANPDECWTDNGYGRFWPCSAGPCGG